MEKFDVEPRNDWVLCEALPQGITAGGLHIPDNAYDDLPRCKVLRVGPGRMTDDGERIPMALSEGDVVHIFGHAISVRAPSDRENRIVLVQEAAIPCVVERAAVN